MLDNNTGQFVNKLQENEKKQQKNKQHQGNGDPANKLPNKTHNH
ncbi:DUF4023 family protein [Peribacillus acanthi]|nr:DUF4023 family protein [Peribacillus acanthi]